jgi:hypothetical protein
MRRFTKLETRSPAIARLPTKTPTSGPSPISGAPATAARTSRTTPRIAAMGEVRRPVAFGGYLILRFRQHSASNFCGSILNRESPNAQLAVLALPDH